MFLLKVNKRFTNIVDSNSSFARKTLVAGVRLTSSGVDDQVIYTVVILSFSYSAQHFLINFSGNFGTHLPGKIETTFVYEFVARYNEV